MCNLKKINNDISIRLDKIKNIEKNICEKYWFKSVYNNIWEDLYKIEFKFHHKNDKAKDNLLSDVWDIKFLQWIVTQSFNWTQDYKDHTNISREDLIKKVKWGMKKYTKWLQILHFIDYVKEDICTDIIIEWYYWWWHANFMKKLDS